MENTKPTELELDYVFQMAHRLSDAVRFAREIERQSKNPYSAQLIGTCRQAFSALDTFAKSCGLTLPMDMP